MFGQVVIGPPGSGKTTYCAGVQQYLRAVGRRVALLNLDPANDALPYEPDVDVCNLVCLERVMAELGLGPNGGLLYCIEYLEANIDWLLDRLQPLEEAGAYLVADCPGQVELFTQHASLRRVVDALARGRGYRLSAVHLVDAHLCTEPSKYVAALLLSLGAMLHLELPHVNVLSKVDLICRYGQLDFPLEFYTEVQDLSYLVRAMGGDHFGARHRKLTRELCDMVQDFGLVSFMPLAIEDKEALQVVLRVVDKANGQLYASLATPGQGLPPEFVYGAAHRAEDDDIVQAMQERYVNRPKAAAAQLDPGCNNAAAANVALRVEEHNGQRDAQQQLQQLGGQQQQQQQQGIGSRPAGYEAGPSPACEGGPVAQGQDESGAPCCHDHHQQQQHQQQQQRQQQQQEQRTLQATMGAPDV